MTPEMILQLAIEDRLLDALMDGDVTPTQAFLVRRVAVVNGCWEWQGVMHHSGYGCLRQNGKFAQAHRVSYAAFKGEPGDLLLCHTCDNPRCINPGHLFLGTHADNMADMKAKGRGRNALSPK